MSIEMDNPSGAYELVDAASNLVEQMGMAHMMGDDSKFNEAKAKAAEFLFNAMRDMEEKGLDE